MDERLRICLWMVGGGVLGSVLGSAFGALTAALYERSGGAAGTGLARRVAEALLDTAVHPPSSTGRAALVGATDGFFFLGTLGLLGGVALGMSGRSANELLMPILMGSLLLIGGAIFFGTLAYALTYHGALFLYGLVGCIVGCLLAMSFLGSGYGPIGAVLGLLIGHILCRALRRYSPKYHSPCVGKTMPPTRSDADIDITSSPPSHANDDFFRKPDSYEEH
jgi:hypothetical protein